MPRVTALRRWVLVGVVLVGSTALFMARRPDELASPYLWDEEGQVVAHWLWHGWHTAFEPIDGDLNALTTGGIVLAGSVGWSVLPAIDYVLAVATFALTAGLLLVPRSAFGPLPVRAAMVIYLAVVPVNPEVYGVMLYSFWWTSLWPIIALGWDDRPSWRRPVVVGLAALNSLAAAALAVVYLPLAWRRRSPELAVSGGVLLAALALQLWAYASSQRAADAALRPVAALEQTMINAGQLVVGRWFQARTTSPLLDSLIGAALLLLMLGSALALRDPRARETGVLLWLGGLLLSGLAAVPAPLMTHPVLAGPRYYFLPFAVFGLLLVYLAGQLVTTWPSATVIARAGGVLACVMLASALSRFPDHGVAVRHSDHVDWASEIKRCATSPQRSVMFPLQRDGVLAHVVRIRFPSARCRELQGR
ncbi:hypothetical protein [Nocardioides sp. CER19]|uniref:hypothetical protein n=1 Tax=Nocardioides sp. CER19 TaxID=3038538 RepID=UPI002448C82F|nr:hypothetical protein [Nocardioides sp. CER19]MDH2414068.1 hypothetical protein [Nocardioides sp. CER19]